MGKPPNRVAAARETEIKLISTPHMLDELRLDVRFRDDPVKRVLTSTYFDTDDYRLAKAKVRLRVRAEGEKFEQTMKRSHNGSSTFATQMEHTCCVDREGLDLVGFSGATRKMIEKLGGGKRLIPIAKTVVEREIRIIKHGSSTIEAAFDCGTIEASGRRGNICELELELKRGKLHDLLSLARDMPLGKELAWSASSKGTRAIRLAANLAEFPCKSEPIVLKPSMPVVAAFQHIAWNCLNQLLRNYRLIIERQDAEALHQSRVALRRLRIATSIFRHVVSDDQTHILVAQWKAIADSLGHGRSLDVMIARIDAQDSSYPKSANPALPLLRRLREQAYHDIVHLLDSASLQNVLFDTALWIERKGLRHQSRTRADGQIKSLPEFALRTVKRQWRRMKEPLRNIKKLETAERHRLRIKVKRIRYATEFFSSVLKPICTAKQFQMFLKAQETLQDCLGVLNDIAPCRSPDIAVSCGLDSIEKATIQALMIQAHPMQPGAEKALLKTAALAGKAMLKSGQQLT